jgi:hypothetical protein
VLGIPCGADGDSDVDVRAKRALAHAGIERERVSCAVVIG